MEVLTKNIASYKGNIYKLVKPEHSKIGLFLTHLGLGDLINMNGAVRYLTKSVDTMYVVCKTRNSKNVSQMFEDEPKIKVLVCEQDPQDYDNLIKDIHREKVDRIIKYFSGQWINRTDYNNIPDVFYDDLMLDHSIRHSCFKLNIQSKLVVPSISYIFVHSTSSTQSIQLDSIINKNTKLVIDPNTNHYSLDHRWHSIADCYINKPIFEYIDVISNADEIHVTDSAFYCLACYLPLKATIKKCYNRETGEVSSQYIFQ